MIKATLIASMAILKVALCAEAFPKVLVEDFKEHTKNTPIDHYDY